MTTQLSKKRHASAKELAVLCQTDTIMTEKFLISCASLGLLERENDLYRNSQVAEQYLVRNSPLYQGHLITLASNVTKYFCRLEETIRSGERNPIWRMHELWDDFILGLFNRHLPGFLAQAFLLSAHGGICGILQPP